ncbi:MAG TPA: iron-sulfur cluster assembly accessory protein [Gammaproteobacteria bacterium]|nr:iron-sulfur cluster assembly accessory protein [Gammaproteobacteria bacterium]
MSVAEVAEFNLILSDAEVKLSEVAQEKMLGLLKDADDEIEAIRVYVSGGGCGGMTYGMTFTDRRSDYDAVREYDKFKIYVDSVALSYLKGVEIDFVEKPTGASFVFNNVFAATGGSGACGACGSASGGCA